MPVATPLTATPEPIMEVGYSVTIVAAWLRARRGNTHGHAESLPIVAVELVRSLLERRVDDQLVTSPVVTPLLRRAGMTVHAVRQRCNDRQATERGELR